MVSESWEDLNPRKDQYGNIEIFDVYYKRIKLKREFSHIPREVFEQWIWAHHDKIESITNYGWLNYENIEFKLCCWSNKQLENIYVIKKFRDYYKNRASYNDFNSFCCTPKDIEQWKDSGTWRIPPIIIDTDSLKKIPKKCELVAPYQLVEGHSRLGYLQSMLTIDKLGKGKVAETHKIYLMREFTCT